MKREKYHLVFNCHMKHHLTYGKSKVWIKTGMDIKNALDPKDEDYIQVVANPLVQNVLTAIQELGFQLREVDCEETPFHFHARSTFCKSLNLFQFEEIIVANSRK